MKVALICIIILITGNACILAIQASDHHETLMNKIERIEESEINLRSYQIQLLDTTMQIWDGNRLVATVECTDTTQEVNNIIYKDNE